MSDDGKEYIQGIFNDGESFGEPPLFINEPYPSTAVAQKDSIILKLNKETFIKILKEYPELQMALIKILSLRTYNKTITARDLIYNKPTHKIKAFLKAYKIKANIPINQL